MIFKHDTDQANYDNACKIAKRLFRLLKLKGGIGVISDQNTNVLSYEFVIHFHDIPINFGSCLTSEELLAKTKLYKELLTDVSIQPDKLFEACAQKVQKNPQFKAILQDLVIVSEFLKHQSLLPTSPLLSQAIH